MGIDVWEVIEATKTKPFGFMPFYPGPGIGGHYIPVDPFYLSWKAAQSGQETKFIELAGDINLSMSDFIIRKLKKAPNLKSTQSFNGLDFLIIGVTYKKNVGDQRETPAFPLMRKLIKGGAHVNFHDPHIPQILPSRHFPELSGAQSILLDDSTLPSYDAVLIITDHDNIDYDLIAENSKIIIDTCNATRNRGISAKSTLLLA